MVIICAEMPVSSSISLPVSCSRTLLLVCVGYKFTMLSTCSLSFLLPTIISSISVNKMSRKTFTGKAESVYKSSPTWADLNFSITSLYRFFR